PGVALFAVFAVVSVGGGPVLGPVLGPVRARPVLVPAGIRAVPVRAVRGVGVRGIVRGVAVAGAVAGGGGGGVGEGVGDAPPFEVGQDPEPAHGARDAGF